MNQSNFIAHPGQSLEDHLLGVGDKAKRFASKIGLSKHGELIGLLHDLGKYSQQFQSYIRSAVGELNPDDDEYVDAGVLKGKIDHSSAGAQYVWEAVSNKGKTGLIAAQILALCIASHHSGLIDCISAEPNNFGEGSFNKRMQKATEKTHLNEVKWLIGDRVLERCSKLLEDNDLINTVEALVKRISECNNNNLITMQQLGLAVRFLFSCLIDADRIDTADAVYTSRCYLRPMGSYIDWTVLIKRLEIYLQNISPAVPIDHLRKDISQHCYEAASRGPGIFTLTVPTGGGKTLASLRFALHHANLRNLDRIIYVIPFTSIIDQNAQVVREVLDPINSIADKNKIVLEHHSNLTPEQQTWHEKILCESWDAPVIYTTMVQLLETLFGSGTRGARRMHQLSNSVIIFDEIQAIPISCIHLFNNAVNFIAGHCNSTVVLCTATQPLLHKVRKDKGAIRLHPHHEIMPDVQRLFDELNRVEVLDKRKPGGWSTKTVSDLALAEVHRSNNCLVIVNTKNVAKEIYKHASNCINQDEIFHLSTDMCPSHRRHVLENVKKKLKSGTRVLCISTQLIEAGVDVDFNTVIRSKAGMDSIAQAAGRCNRNGKSKHGLLYIVNIPNERVEKLHDIYIGQKISDRIMDDFRLNPERYSKNLIGPQSLYDYYQYYFFERSREMEYPISKKDFGHDDTLLNLLSNNHQAVNEYGKINKSKPNILFRQSFMSAAKAFKSIDAPTEGIIVPYGSVGSNLIVELCATKEIDKQYALLKKAQQFTVNVFPHIMSSLIKNQAVRKIRDDVNIMFLDTNYYSDDFGLSTDPIHHIPLEKSHAL